ncbi:3-keto-5-aminohexanoate cleavage protein [Umezawaea sp. Da 62-37]|uniref:3-keto-5-aminohexanoate cleavage protein n=1 Tax=Umezawaea sp. Da 62-37 TaxID=3075927 RepID=UPI0028F715FD|nr:3-keto-5-aminohexanoate cleavage protein [Umezawaea sp. Da 62-37]WNV90011.1 3-keto-5-aminohexanoate cleavage protein [Umezawaea sp. Da 62-37]
MDHVLQACLNGGRPVGSHPALPVSSAQLAADAVAVAERGVAHLHLHPRDLVGLEVLAGPEVATAVAVVRAAVPGVEIGVTTGAWIQPDPVRRAELVAGWAGLAAGRPDVASVNVHEDGWQGVCAALHRAGIGIELGVHDEAAARALVAQGPPPGTRRVLAEVRPGADPVPEAEALLRLLEPLGLPVLLHGEDATAWPVLGYAARLELDARIGLEDTLLRPDGTPATDNADLVGYAVRTLRSLGPR